MKHGHGHAICGSKNQRSMQTGTQALMAVEKQSMVANMLLCCVSVSAVEMRASDA